MNKKHSKWTLIAEISNTFDLGGLLSELNAKEISYRLKPLEKKYELWLEFEDQVPQALQLLEQTKKYRQRKTLQEDTQYDLQNQAFSTQLRKLPVVTALLILSIIGTLVVEYAFPLVHFLTFQDFILVGQKIDFGTAKNAINQGEYWRLVTPAFLHFGFFHVVFNGLWLWEFGRRIEPIVGDIHFIAIVLLIAVASNLGQYLWSGPALFGGMSGVVYGLLGYIWIRHKVAPRAEWVIPSGLLGFMLLWLLLGMSGMLEFVMSGSIANAAHGFGLVTGMTLGGWAGYSEPKHSESK